MKRGFQAFREIAATGVLCAAPAIWIATPAMGQATLPIAAPINQSAIPVDVLIGMYRTELRDAFLPGASSKLLAAHELIEAYFAATTSADHAAIAGKIAGLGLDAVAVGRLTRLRMYWPALAGGGVYYINQKRGPYITPNTSSVFRRRTIALAHGRWW